MGTKCERSRQFTQLRCLSWPGILAGQVKQVLKVMECVDIMIVVDILSTQNNQKGQKAVEAASTPRSVPSVPTTLHTEQLWTGLSDIKYDKTNEHNYVERASLSGSRGQQCS
jgi:hypothetical protein